MTVCNVIRIRLDENQVEKVVLSLIGSAEQKAKLITNMTNATCKIVDGEMELAIEPEETDFWFRILSDSKSSDKDLEKISPSGNSLSFEARSAGNIDTSQDHKSESEYDLIDQCENSGPSNSEVSKRHTSENPFLLKNAEGITFFHECAQSGKLDEIPSDFWTEEVWDTSDDNGESFVHWSGRFGTINQVPSKFHDPNLLLVKDNFGETFLHKAAFNGHLEKTPGILLVEKFLLQKNNLDQNCLHRAAFGGHLNQIPKELLKKQNLESKDTNGKSVIDYAQETETISHLPAKF